MDTGQRSGRDRSELSTHRSSRSVKGALLLVFAALLSLILYNTTISLPSNAEAQCDCGYCHGDNHHGDDWSGCSGCHDSPPQTGTHRLHYNSDPIQSLKYGDTTVTSTADAYQFGCGNCHPLDKTKHNNGTVEVELYNVAAPTDSLKAMNPSSALYTPGSTVTTYASKIPSGRQLSWTNGTCNDIYCHSGNTVSSGPVGLPLTTADNPALFPPGYKLNRGYIMDETCSNLTYAPYTVNYQRVYKTTPAWGTTGTFVSCKECHAFPLTTWEPDVQAMVGDTHQWVTYNTTWQDWWNQGHAYNMGYTGIPCATCHFGTANHYPGSVSNPPTTRPTYWVVVNGAWIYDYYPVTVRSRAAHVNGTPDVSFDTTNGYRYYWPNWRNTLVNLSSATYDPATKTCSNVGCHYGPPLNNDQRVAKWGFPNRMNEGVSGAECDVCHRYGYLNETCTTP